MSGLLSGISAEWAPGIPAAKALGITHSAFLLLHSANHSFTRKWPLHGLTPGSTLEIADTCCSIQLRCVWCDRVLHKLNDTSEESSERKRGSSVCTASYYLCGKALTLSALITVAPHTVMSHMKQVKHWSWGNTVSCSYIKQLNRCFWDIFTSDGRIYREVCASCLIYLWSKVSASWSFSLLLNTLFS